MTYDGNCLFDNLYEKTLKGQNSISKFRGQLICLVYIRSKPRWEKIGGMTYILVLILPH